MTSVSGFSKENVHYMHACSYTRYYYYHNHYYVYYRYRVGQRQSRIYKTASRTVQVSYTLLIFSAYLLLKASDNVLAIKEVYKRANLFLNIHVF